MLRFARSLPPGPERNGRRQIAASLRSLVRNTKWLAANEAPVKEYRVYAVDTEGHFIKTIKLDCPDDASATESARQFMTASTPHRRAAEYPIGTLACPHRLKTKATGDVSRWVAHASFGSFQ